MKNTMGSREKLIDYLIYKINKIDRVKNKEDRFRLDAVIFYLLAFFSVIPLLLNIESKINENYHPIAGSLLFLTFSVIFIIFGLYFLKNLKEKVEMQPNKSKAYRKLLKKSIIQDLSFSKIKRELNKIESNEEKGE